MAHPIDPDVTELFMLSMGMFAGREEREILDLAIAAVPSLGRLRVVGTYLTADGVVRTPDGRPLSGADLAGQLLALDGEDGPVTSPAAAWARAFALRHPAGHAGYLVVGADDEASDRQQALVRMLAQQTGIALGEAAEHRKERETAAELRRMTVELAGDNEQLTSSVTDLVRRRRIHEVLTAVAAAGAGKRGIAGAVHDLTGLPVVVEDQFGNVRAWAGPHRPESSGRSTALRRDELIARADGGARPVRDRDRVVALVQPRDEVLGVLALVDPDRRAGEHELVALEEGALLLAIELAHERALAESELRLRRDLVDDLLSGTDDESALHRAAALGHNLAVPHHVLLVSWAGTARGRAVEQAVERAVAALLRTRPLLARRPDGVVAIMPRPTRNGGDRWHDVHRAMAEHLRSTDGSIGVGAAVPVPSLIPRSYEQARRALRIRQAGGAPAGVTAYEDLGVYRLLAAGDAGMAKAFVREWLGPLLDYDASNSTEMVRTLWQYYECGGNYDATAKALHIHRSTLRYRLRRIRELTGHDLNVVDRRLNLHIATRAWHVLRAGGEGAGRRVRSRA